MVEGTRLCPLTSHGVKKMMQKSIVCHLVQPLQCPVLGCCVPGHNMPVAHPSAILGHLAHLFEGLAASCAALWYLKAITSANVIRNLSLTPWWCTTVWCLVVYLSQLSFPYSYSSSNCPYALLSCSQWNCMSIIFVCFVWIVQVVMPLIAMMSMTMNIGCCGCPNPCQMFHSCTTFLHWCRLLVSLSLWWTTLLLWLCEQHPGWCHCGG